MPLVRAEISHRSSKLREVSHPADKDAAPTGLASFPAGRRLRIALLADELLTVGGAEQVFLHMTAAFPEADIFTLAYHPKTTHPEFRKLKVRASALNWLLRTHRLFKLMFVPSTIFMEQWHLGDYDVVLSSSATTAKYLRKCRAVHICYCYFPTRAIWDGRNYFAGMRDDLAYRAFRAMLPWIKRRDLAAAARIDHFITLSETARRAIKHVYRRDARVVFSPIPVEQFRAGLREPKENHFLIVSRLESWKRVDYAIEAFNALGLQLRIIGTGSDLARLRAMANKNITFLGAVSKNQLIEEYGRARAVIFTPALEYGLVPLEAAAAGTPVIALGHGGVRETMLGQEEAARDGRMPTAVFYQKQTADDLIGAVRRFESLAFDRDALSAHAVSFGIEPFKQRLRELVLELIGAEQPTVRPQAEAVPARRAVAASA